MTDTPRHRDYPVTTAVRVFYCACGGQLMPGNLSRPTVPPKLRHLCAFCSKECWLTAASGSTYTTRDYPMAIEAEEQP